MAECREIQSALIKSASSWKAIHLHVSSSSFICGIIDSAFDA